MEAQGDLAVGGAPVARDSIFRISSDTQSSITAAAVLALIAAGRLDLDEPVDRLLPELADRQVLRRVDGPLDDSVPTNRAHHPARPAHVHVRAWAVFEMFAPPSKPWPVVASSEQAAAWPRSDSPTAVFSRIRHLDGRAGLACPCWLRRGSAGSTTPAPPVLGVLAARAAGQPFGDVLPTRVLEPLGIASTGLWTRADRASSDGLPTEGENGLVAWDEPDGGSSPAADVQVRFCRPGIDRR